MWRKMIQEKFEEKFPDYYKGCKDEKWYFIQSDHLCCVFNTELEKVCTFTYKNEDEYSLEISRHRSMKRR